MPPHWDHQILKVEYQNLLWSFHVKFFCIYSQNSCVCTKPSFNFLVINRQNNITLKCDVRNITLNPYFLLLQGGRQWLHFGGAKLLLVILLKTLFSSYLPHFGKSSSSKTFIPLNSQLICRYYLKKLQIWTLV